MPYDCQENKDGWTQAPGQMQESPPASSDLPGADLILWLLWTGLFQHLLLEFSPLRTCCHYPPIVSSFGSNPKLHRK